MLYVLLGLLVSVLVLQFVLIAVLFLMLGQRETLRSGEADDTASNDRADAYLCLGFCLDYFIDTDSKEGTWFIEQAINEWAKQGIAETRLEQANAAFAEAVNEPEIITFPLHEPITSQTSHCQPRCPSSCHESHSSNDA